ncbi:hypothetical protein K3N28_05905 [Glycomyces sp. TRM65418]|uniref:hypothetical protein n=1 Tax=Glycomyces sp. TRM65418 TaxID=2867006 RepID=UPI001CE71441|nr:hypothetical protein [Glycomyces sp. TRM65418]MCC3762603.1 hypothetical protein [Glycomyces sp. TRM65418]QZD56641.1 hypothetical protein K3N28_05865 [Glycomyces sp. TRM65418]
MTMQQLHTDLLAVPGAILGVALVLIAIARFGTVNRAKIRIRLNKLAWIALGVGTVGLCTWGYLASLLP